MREFYQTYPLNMIEFWIVAAVAVAALLAPRGGGSWLRPVEAFFGRFARRRKSAVVAVGARRAPPVLRVGRGRDGEEGSARCSSNVTRVR